MADTTKIDAGPYFVGEVPEPLEISVTEYGGTEPYVLTGATVDGSWNIEDGTDGALSVSVVDAAAGLVRVTWGASQFTTAGLLRATVWAEFGSGVKPVLARIFASVSDPGADID